MEEGLSSRIEFGHEARLSAWQPPNTLKNYVAVVNRRSRGPGCLCQWPVSAT